MMQEQSLYSRGGIITERDAEYATVRVRIPAGVLSAAQVRQLGKISEKYGDGTLHLTMRQTVEIPHVKPENFEKVAKALEKNGTPLGAEQNEGVNIMACPGTERYGPPASARGSRFSAGSSSTSTMKVWA